MNLPDEVMLRLEPLGGLMGGPSGIHRAFCPACGELMVYYHDTNHGCCTSCAVTFDLISEVRDTKTGDYGSRLLRLRVTYPYIDLYRVRQQDQYRDIPFL